MGFFLFFWGGGRGLLAKLVCLLGRRSGHAQVLCNSWVAPTRIKTNGRHDEPWKKLNCKEKTIHNNNLKDTENENKHSERAQSTATNH